MSELSDLLSSTKCTKMLPFLLIIYVLTVLSSMTFVIVKLC